jgi:hypothetical protein
MSSRSILWTQVWGVAGVHGAISLCWVIYGLYIPELLASLDFPPDMVPHLLAIENLLSAGIEPVMGAVSDRWQRLIGTKMPVIMAGALLSAGLFILVPVSLVLGIDRQAFLGVVIIWAMAMAILRSPVLSLLAGLAIDTGLPQAMGVLTLVGGVVNALRFVVGKLILSLSAPVTFVIGSLALLGGVITLKVLLAKRPSLVSEASGRQIPVPFLRLGFLLLLGLLMGWGSRITLGEVVPASLRLHLADISLPMGVVFLVMAGGAIGSAYAITFWNHPQKNHGTVAIGLLVVVVSLWLVTVNWGMIWKFAILLCLALGLGTATNGVIPLGLEFLPVGCGGLAMGVYFGGTGLAIALFNWWLAPQAGSLDLGIMALMAQGALAIAGISCIFTKSYNH